MMAEEEFVRLVADILNRDSSARERERRVREANRRLYREVVSPKATDAQADLALVRAALRERKYSNDK